MLLLRPFVFREPVLKPLPAHPWGFGCCPQAKLLWKWELHISFPLIFASKFWSERQQGTLRKYDHRDPSWSLTTKSVQGLFYTWRMPGNGPPLTLTARPPSEDINRWFLSQLLLGVYTKQDSLREWEQKGMEKIGLRLYLPVAWLAVWDRERWWNFPPPQCCLISFRNDTIVREKIPMWEGEQKTRSGSTSDTVWPRKQGTKYHHKWPHYPRGFQTVAG